MGQSTYAKTQKFINLQDLWTFLRHHKVITIAALGLIFIVAASVIYAQMQNANKFSREDFDRVTTMAKEVLVDTGATNVGSNQTCSKNYGEFITLPHLTCRVQLIVYLQYVNDSNVVAIMRRFDRNIEKVFGKPSLDFSAVYRNPHMVSDVAYVRLDSSFGNRSCSFGVDTNSYAQRVALFLPRIPDTNLVALSFDCTADARTQYFTLAD